MAVGIIRANRRGGAGAICLLAGSLDVAGTARAFMARKQALRFAKSIVARRAKLVRARSVRTSETSAGSIGATAKLLAQAQARIAALPPGFTDDLRYAPPFPPDALEILGGD